MERWSLNKRFKRKIAWHNFERIVDLFATECAKAWQCNVTITTKLYKGIPTSLTIAKKNECVQRGNESSVTKISPFRLTSYFDFHRAGFIRVRIEPKRQEEAPPHAFGQVSFKGFMRHSAVFCLKGGNKESLASAQFLKKFSWWKWFVGDGLEHNHIISVY